MDKRVTCPHCGTAVIWGPASPWRPFCSERCRLIDLGDWLEENHRIADRDDLSNGDPSAETHPPGAH